MPANVHGQMVYSFEKPMWHSLGTVGDKPMTAEEIGDTHFGGFFPIELRETSFLMNGVQTIEDFAIIRGASAYDPKEIKIGNCTKRFHPLQPREIAHCYDVNVNQPAETMGFLGHGEDMFISWKMPSFEVCIGDEVEMYGIVRAGFDGKHGAHLFTSTYRPVCANTLTAAAGWAKRNTDGRGRGDVWTGKATSTDLLRDLGFWMSHVQLNAIREARTLQELFSKFAKTPIQSDAHAQELLAIAFPEKNPVPEFFPVQLRGAEQAKRDEINEDQKEIRDGIFTLFAGEGTVITPDFWGLTNATSEFFCHVQPSKKPIAESVMFGARQENIMRVVKTLADRAR